MTILVADDDARMRQMVKQIVAGFATEVYEAGDGGEAIAICDAQRPDWVLMDFRMRPMDGLRGTAEIKARFPETHIVIVSQYDEAELRAEAARAGACAYVLKENLHELPAILAGTTLGALAPSSTTALNHNRTPIPSNH
jgi:CheY-like chemotaxis protein